MYLRHPLTTLAATAVAVTAVVSATVTAAPAADAAAGQAGSGYQVLTNGQKSALDLQILQNFIPFAESFWRASNISQPDTGYFLGVGPGVAQPRGDGNVDYVLATLLTALPDQQSFAGVSRATLLSQLIESIRYTAFTNVYSGAGYNQWGAATGPASDGEFSLETYSWAGAAYLIWNQLDPGTQALVKTVLTAEANLVASLPPVDAVTGNTGGETDAWDVPTPALAAVMFPDDPDAPLWRATAIRYALNSSSMPGDETSSQVVDGHPLSYWISTDNIHSDLTLENHGYFNIDYQMVTHLLINDAAIFYAQAKVPQPQAFSFRTDEIWQKVIEPLTDDDGDLISPAGQDWASKDYQWVDYLGEMATRFGSPVASVLESRALQLVARRQAGTGNGSITGMSELGYEAMLARRISADWWDHKLFPPSPAPSQHAFDTAYQASGGVHQWPDVDVIAGRFSGATATMSWDSESPMGSWQPRTYSDMTDPAFTQDAPQSLFNTARGTPTGPYTCTCGTDQFATAGTVGSKNLAMAAFSDGTTLLLDQGTGATFTYTLDQIPGLTGPRPVYSAGGTGLGTLTGNWVDVDDRMAMIVAGGSGISAATLAPGSNFGSNDTPLVLTGSTGTGSGNRGAELAAAPAATAAALAPNMVQPTVPAGWGALQAQAPDGSDRLVVARWSGPATTTVALTDPRGAPVPAETATVTGATTSLTLSPGGLFPTGPAAVQDTFRYFVRSSAPVQVRQSSGGTATLSNPGPDPVSVTVTYVPPSGTAQTVSRTLAAGESAVARLAGGRLVTAGPEYQPILAAAAGASSLISSVQQWSQAGLISSSGAARLTSAATEIAGDLGQAAAAATATAPDTAQEATLVSSAASALGQVAPGPGMSAAVARAVQATHDREATDLAQAQAALRVALLVVPDGVIQPGGSARLTIYALNRSSGAASAGQLTVTVPAWQESTSAPAFTALAQGATTSATVSLPVPAGAAPGSGVTADASVSYTAQDGSRQVVTGSLGLAVIPLLAVTADQPNLNLAPGGWNQETYTITSLDSVPLTVALAAQGPAGVTVTPAATAAVIPADGSAQVTATVADASVSSGTGSITLTATSSGASAGVAVTASSQLDFSSDLALNAYQTPWPAAFASSSQSAYPPSLAFDGSTESIWVSGGPATAGSGPTPQAPVTLGVDFGAPVTIGSVTMTPRADYGPTDYSIQVSADGQDWTTIATVTSAPNAAVTTTVTPVTAQYLRLLITGSHDTTDRNVQVAEVDVQAP